MRIVEFDVVDVVIAYPFEGQSAFGITMRVGDKIVGEYTGTATVGQLANYPDEWPIPRPPSYRTFITVQEFYNPDTGLNGVEQKIIRDYADDDNNVDYGEVYAFNSQIDASENIDLQSQGVIDGMTLLVTLGLLTQPRYDSIMQGIA